MSFFVGIVGLPNVGKSTLFKALTKKKVDIAPYPFTTIEPNIGIVAIPDQRLEKIAEVIKPEKITPTIIKFVDIAGLVKNAHKGEGLGNQFLGHIRECDAILEVTRAFFSPDIEHTQGNVDPKRDIEIIKTELLMKDLETTRKTIEKLEKDAKSGDKETAKKLNTLKKIEQGVLDNKKILEMGLNEEEISEIKEFQFLTLKPTIHIFNTGKDQKFQPLPEIPSFFTTELKLEEEISELSEGDIKELGLASKLDSLIIACYNILDLITFYTVAGGKESRAWTLKKGKKCQEAGGVVHSDFEEKFIKAEVINWQKLVAASFSENEASLALKGREVWPKAKEKGEVRTEGKDYIVQDGDVIEFKI